MTHSLKRLWLTLALLAACQAAASAQALNITVNGFPLNTARVAITVDGGSLAEPLRVQLIPAPGATAVSTILPVPAGGPYRIRAVDGQNASGATFFAVTASGQASVVPLQTGQTVPVTVSLATITAGLVQPAPTSVLTNNTFNLAVNATDPGNALDLTAGTVRYGTSATNLPQTVQGSASKPTPQTWRLTASIPTPPVPGTLYYQIEKMLPSFGAPGTLFAYVWPQQASVSIPVTDGSSAGIPVTPSQLTFTYTPGAPLPAPQDLTLSGGLAAVTFTVAASSTPANWLSVTPLSGRTPATLSVSVNPAGLASGTYQGSVDISSAGPAPAVRSVPVTLTITGSTSAALQANPASLTFQSVPLAPPPPAQEVAVTSTGAPITFAAAASSTGNWLAVAPLLSTTPAQLTITVSPAGLEAGSYTGTITLTPQGSAAATVNIGVTLIVGSSLPVLSAQPATLHSDGATPAPQIVNIASSAGAISFQAAASSPGNWLNVAPSFAVTPAQLTVSVNTQGLSTGAYSGAYSGAIEITTNQAANSPLRIPVTLQIGQTPGGPVINAVVSAASYEGLTVAAGEIVVIYGTGLGPNRLTTLRLENGKVATSLAGTEVFMNGIPAPILYTSPNQVSAVVPYGVAGASGAFVRALYNGVSSQSAVLLVAESKPAIFTLDASGLGPAAVRNQDNSVNTPQNPANTGSIVQIFATGTGLTSPASSDGVLTEAPFPATLLPARVFFDGREGDILDAGAAPSSVAGLTQINSRIPTGVTPSSAVNLILEIGGRRSQMGATIAVR